jgi:hypothetical protein
MPRGPRGEKRPRDFSQAAKLVVDIASGQVEDREPTPEERGIDPAASAMGRKGGPARAASMNDLASRLASRIQLTSDGHKAYLEAVEGAFGADIDYAMLVKIYGAAPDSAKGRYSPADCTGAHKHRIEGSPDPKHVSTSFSERSNLTLRMHMRRFTRLTNAFSKKVENHMHAVALHMMYYNFVRIHQTLRTTPAMAADITKRLWEVTDVVDVLEAWEASKPLT